MDGQEVSTSVLDMSLSGSRRLQPEDISFEKEIDADLDRLNFYIPVRFDPAEVFGIQGVTGDNDDYLNVYADYNLDSASVCDDLYVILVILVILYYGEDVMEYHYPLTEQEKDILAQKMNAYCLETAGQSLAEWHEESLSEQDGNTMQL